MNTKTKINVILPTALAVILPGMNFFSNSVSFLADGMSFYQRWAYASVMLYLLWYILLYTSQIKTRYKWPLVFLSLTAFISLTHLLFSIFVFEIPDPVRWVFIFKIIFASVLFLIIQYALKAGADITRLQLEKEQIQLENYKIQLQELRAKVDPHFLFNSLNTLRTMVRNQHEESEQFVLSLSDFYRSTLKYNEETTIRLFEEMNVLKAYLFLMKSRNEDAVTIDFQINESYEQYLIPTLALQAVVENCFKHNQMTSKQPLRIEIRTTGDFYIEVKNKIQPRLDHKESSGYGLKNIERRYELLKVQDGVKTERTQTEFTVRLKLL